VAVKSRIAVKVRYALTLSQPILLLADVKKIELIVQTRDVNNAAPSPTNAEFTMTHFSVESQLGLY
jgi:hypothetical protein